MKKPGVIKLSVDELSELIRFSQESKEPICATYPGGNLIVAKTGMATLRKLAEMRGVSVD